MILSHQYIAIEIVLSYFYYVDSMSVSNKHDYVRLSNEINYMLVYW